MENEIKSQRKRIFSEEQKANLFKGSEPFLTKKSIPKIENEMFIRVEFKANLETQYLLNCLCKKKKLSRDILLTKMINQEAKKENIGISLHS
jgi:hypothetical protein